jgi:hypothetical protein
VSNIHLETAQQHRFIRTTSRQTLDNKIAIHNRRQQQTKTTRTRHNNAGPDTTKQECTSQRIKHENEEARERHETENTQQQARKLIKRSTPTDTRSALAVEQVHAPS